ncbi:MAG: carboxylate--amine ligase [Chlorobiaceae bacterium]|nr:carboxylate--amine ligase [Chlorobiaceae bacterium]
MIKSLVNSSLKVPVKVQCIDSQRLQYIEIWLRDVLDIKEIEPYNFQNENDDAACSTRELLQYQLHVMRLFFQLGNMPIFDLPAVLSFYLEDQKRNIFHAEIQVDKIEAVPESVYQSVINSSVAICVWMSENPLYASDKNKYYATIREKIIKPLQSMVPAGKSTIPLLKVVHSLGIPFIHLGLGVYQLGWGSKARIMDRSTTAQDSAIGAKLVQNKLATAHILRKAALPAPTHEMVVTENDAISSADRIGYPIVVKPLDQDRGIGVSTDIYNEKNLKTAFRSALQLSSSKRVIIEKQVSGVCHRLFIANGKLLYAVKRLPMSVIGDGIKNVKELVDAELLIQSNRPPWTRTEISAIDELAKTAIIQAGFTLNSVPESGAFVPLRKIESTEWGGIDEEVTEKVHPENVAIAINAARLFGLYIAGIDIITEDISTPWFENGAIINEVNFSPLFGGGEISRRHIPLFIRDFIDGDGKIPVSIFEKNQTQQAVAYQQQLIKSGVHCYLVSENESIDSNGQSIFHGSLELNAKITALFMNSKVDAIVVVTSKNDCVYV